jgi:nucleotide-binding universal stress UspA family protein
MWYDNEALEGAEEKRQMHHANDILDKAEEMVKGYAPNTKIQKIAKIGNPADEIIDTADEEQIDIIIIGSQGMSDAKRFWIGSVSTKVVAHAKQSILVVK